MPELVNLDGARVYLAALDGLDARRVPELVNLDGARVYLAALDGGRVPELVNLDGGPVPELDDLEPPEST